MSEPHFCVDISRILNGELKTIPFTFTLHPEDTEPMDLAFAKDAEVSGNAYEKAHGAGKSDSYVELTFTLDASYTTHCGRCAKELTRPYHIEKTYGIAKKLTADSENYVEAPTGVVDVYELAETAFYLELPVRVLCRDDCKGLCPVCGKDKNEGDCGCETESRANRISGLSSLRLTDFPE